MRTFLIRLRTFVNETGALIKSRFLPAQKRNIFGSYLRLATVSLFGGGHAGPVTRKICNMKVTSFNHSTLLVLFREVFLRGVYFFSSTKTTPRIIDCGGNIGTATLFFKWLYPNAVITTFEPDPETYQTLVKNIEANDLINVTTHNVALGAIDGSVPFYIDNSIAGSPKMSTRPLEETDKNRTISVPMKRLSAYITEHIDYLKIDTEGAETDMINELYTSGALEHVNEIGIEYHHHLGGAASGLAQLLGPLENAGFDYKLDARYNPSAKSKSNFQHIMIYAWKKR